MSRSFSSLGVHPHPVPTCATIRRWLPGEYTLQTERAGKRGPRHAIDSCVLVEDNWDGWEAFGDGWKTLRALNRLRVGGKDEYVGGGGAAPLYWIRRVK